MTSNEEKKAEETKKTGGVYKDGMICYELGKEPVEAKEAPPPETPITPIISETLSTCPPDPRFQQQNKTKWCYRMFIDFHRCAHYLGEDNHHCKLFKKCYLCLCPNHWIKKWEEEIIAGTFPRDLKKEMGY